jgi:hypothetical protein
VRYVLKSDAELLMVDAPAHTDALGLRVRPGPPPPDDALRIAVLGDSVAFGFGVEDDQTLAAHLERLLLESRGPAARPVACFTVAVPSWNHHAELAFLSDHWDAVRADIVVCMPIPNDLGDAGALYESGRLRLDSDPMQPDPWLLVSRSLLGTIETNIEAVLGRGRLDTDFLGVCALEADLTPESRRRYEDNVASLVDMERLLAARGARLLVAFAEQTTYSWQLAARLAQAAPELPLVFFERYLPAECTLVVDPHPSAATHAVRAGWLARELLDRGLVERGAALPLPEVPAEHERLRGPACTPAQLQDYADKARGFAREELLDEIDFQGGKGIRQVIGGLNVDRSVRMHALMVLKANGPDVRLELAPWSTRRDLYPLRVDVELAGEPAGSIVIEPLKSLDVRLPLPASLAPGEPFEIRLLPADWCVAQDRGFTQVVAFRPLRVSCRAP